MVHAHHLVDTLRVLGGGVRAYAACDGIALVPFDQVGPWTVRDHPPIIIETPAALAAYIATHARRGSTQLVTLAAMAWARHEDIATELRTIDVPCTEVTLAGEPS